MKFPKLKHAMFCRIFIYVVVLGAFFVPIAILLSLSFITETIKALGVLLLIVLLLVYLVKNFIVLMAMDILLASLYCQNTARRSFNLYKKRSIVKIQRSIIHHGREQVPTALCPKPDILRYKAQISQTVYCRSIEKIIATYSCEFLDEVEYQKIINSASANVKALIGHKKTIRTDPSQKNVPIHTVGVIVIFAMHVDEKLNVKLFDFVGKQAGDGWKYAIMPCVIDTQTMRCTFDSVRIPYVGMEYPVKNRGYHLIKKHVFGGKIPRKGNELLISIKDYNPEESLWEFWHRMKVELILNDKEMKKIFESLKDEEILYEEDYLYLKWQERGVCLNVELDEDRKIVTVDAVDSWSYPRINKISKELINKTEKRISLYFNQMGYTTMFNSIDE